MMKIFPYCYYPELTLVRLLNQMAFGYRLRSIQKLQAQFEKKSEKTYSLIFNLTERCYYLLELLYLNVNSRY